MEKKFSAEKYLSAQAYSYDMALSEISNGRKVGHWIWYIFPQIDGLGHSFISKQYAIQSLDEAKEYLQNEVLKKRLVAICETLLRQDKSAQEIFGFPDVLKVRSSVTLFREADSSINVFQNVLDKFYDGQPDEKTLQIIASQENHQSKPSRAEMVRVFQDTLTWIRENPVLQKAVADSTANTRFYSPDDTMILPQNPHYQPSYSVTAHRSFEAVQKLRQRMPDERFAVLNFASATHAGGGVEVGSRTQEEALCRCSTLYPCLNQSELSEKYYQYHQEKYDCFYSDAVIYVPDVLVIKTDTSIPERMLPEQWFKTDIITCAAPNLRYNPDIISPEEQYLVHRKRAKRIISSAVIGGASVLVLGAFGCGAFQNNPRMVAKAFRDVLAEFEGYFRYVEFAVFYVGKESDNYSAFADVFQDIS